LRIAYFVWEYPPRLVGGLGTYAAEITKKFAELGHELVVFTMNDEGKLKTKDSLDGIEIHRPILADATGVLPIFIDEEIKKWGSGMKFFSDVLTYNFLAANKFVNSVSREKDFDLIACHDWLSSIAGIISKRNLNKPLVFHVHSTEFGRSGGDGSQTIRGLEFETAKMADLIVTVSFAMREELYKLSFPADKIRVCWNGVDEKKYDVERIGKQKIGEYRNKIGVREDEKIILFTGRLTWVKGINSLVRAMPEILSQAPKTKLVVLGRGEMAEELKVLASQLNVTDKIIFIDKWVEEVERLLIYASSDLVCAPSRYEPFGIVCLEAMSMKKPVIVGNGGLREPVVEGEEGYYCNPDNPHDIADKAIRILKDDELARQFGENGRRRVEGNFTWDKIARSTIDLYQAMLDKAKK
jgi:glycosyltransferase involved in cell wall biosynthesis